MLETWDKNSSKCVLGIPKVLITEDGDKRGERHAGGEEDCSDSKGGSAKMSLLPMTLRPEMSWKNWNEIELWGKEE